VAFFFSVAGEEKGTVNPENWPKKDLTLFLISSPGLVATIFYQRQL
jgi:hypothetical protein